MRAFANQYRRIRYLKYTQSVLNAFIAGMTPEELDTLNPTSLYNRIVSADIVGEIKTDTDNLYNPENLGQGENLFAIISPNETNSGGGLVQDIDISRPGDGERLYLKPQAVGAWVEMKILKGQYPFTEILF